MGVIDKKVYTLRCPDCGASERAVVLDKGSMWSGSHWQGSAPFTLFITAWRGGGKEEPQLVTAGCKQCNHSGNCIRGIQHMSARGPRKPSDFEIGGTKAVIIGGGRYTAESAVDIEMFPPLKLNYPFPSKRIMSRDGSEVDPITFEAQKWWTDTDALLTAAKTGYAHAIIALALRAFASSQVSAAPQAEEVPGIRPDLVAAGPAFAGDAFVMAAYQCERALFQLEHRLKHNVKELRDELLAALPGLTPVRHSIAHADERVQGLKKASKKTPGSEKIRLREPLRTGYMNDDEYEWTSPDGYVFYVPVTEDTVLLLYSVLSRVQERLVDFEYPP